MKQIHSSKEIKEGGYFLAYDYDWKNKKKLKKAYLIIVDKKVVTQYAFKKDQFVTGMKKGDKITKDIDGVRMIYNLNEAGWDVYKLDEEETEKYIRELAILLL